LQADALFAGLFSPQTSVAVHNSCPVNKAPADNIATMLPFSRKQMATL